LWPSWAEWEEAPLLASRGADHIFLHIERYRLEMKPSARFRLDDIAKAHELLDSERANGKIVVETGA